MNLLTRIEFKYLAWKLHRAERKYEALRRSMFS